MQMNLFGLHCRGVNSINDEVKYTQKPRAMQMFCICIPISNVL